MPEPSSRAAGAEVVLPCRELGQCQEFFASIGFRLDSIFPADDPRCLTMSGFGLCLRLVRGENEGGGHLCIPGGSGERIAPNGTRIEFVGTEAPLLATAPATFVLSSARESRWVEGRAGMLYRDLIPGRQAGALIASQIRIERGGPVPDYVHFHDVQFQIIHCRKGHVRVVYEDQGPPFVMREGDTVLQPPGIRHRVLDCSDNLEVIEISSPAEHVTHVDHDLALPTEAARPDRLFAGQRFVWHRANGAEWRPWRGSGFEASDTGIGMATDGSVAVRTVRAPRIEAVVGFETTDSRTFWFVLRGGASLVGEQAHELREGDACVMPPRMPVELRASADLSMLEICS